MYKIIEIQCVSDTYYFFDSRSTDKWEIKNNRIVITNNDKDNVVMVINMNNVISYTVREVGEINE